jgi:hypothetical protein
VSEAGARAEILNEAKDSVQDFVISSFSLAMLSEFGQKFFCAFDSRCKDPNGRRRDPASYNR